MLFADVVADMGLIRLCSGHLQQCVTRSVISDNKSPVYDLYYIYDESLNCQPSSNVLWMSIHAELS